MIVTRNVEIERKCWLNVDQFIDDILQLKRSIAFYHSAKEALVQCCQFIGMRVVLPFRVLEFDARASCQFGRPCCRREGAYAMATGSDNA